MKKILLLLILSCSFLSQAQIVTIPDANFKTKLLQADVTNSIAYVGGLRVKIDTNLDGNIQETEAMIIDSLNVSSSGITNLTGIQSFINVKSLRCHSNQITGNLNLNTLTQLITLQCYINEITGLEVTASPNLKSINMYGNLLTAIDLSQNNSIEELSLSSNNLTELNLDNLVQLKYLDCGGNQLETLNCNNNPNLEYVFIQSPILKYLFIKNGVDESTTMDEGSWFELFCCSPNLEYICCDAMQYENILMRIEQAQLFNCQVNTYCSFTPGGDYNTITGLTQFDLDNNGCDASDFAFPFLKIDINLEGVTTNSSVFSNESGNYQIFTNEVGTYELLPDIENPTYFVVTPNPAAIAIPVIDNSTTIQNFCVTANGVHPDLEIAIAPVIPARPGFEAIYQIVYRNIGNQTLSQQYGINFFYNENLMDFVSATETASSAGEGALSWDYADLKPFESRSFELTFNINPPTDFTFPVNMADILTFTATILPQNGDENTMNNLFVFDQMVVGSYDPNDITCLEGDVVSPTTIGNYLHYNVRFENTGTFEAENIVVKIEVEDNEFDTASIRILKASHNVTIRKNGKIVEFVFQNIQLETGGHGNVLLKIKTKNSLVTGDTVSKRADIYFDYNFPIDTGLATTTFENLSVNVFPLDTLITVFPNPAQSQVTITSDALLQSIALYDVQGRLIWTKIRNENSVSIDISGQSAGIYFLKIKTDKGFKIEKLVIK